MDHSVCLAISLQVCHLIPLERIRISSGYRNQLLFNNTIINTFSILSRKKREASTDYEAPPQSDEFLLLECSGVQGDHQVVWTTDNEVVGDENGTVNCDISRPNMQQILSNYSSRYMKQLYLMTNCLVAVFSPTKQLCLIRK